MIHHKILLVDDHTLIMDGLASLIAPYPRFQIVQYLNDGRNVYNACLNHNPDIIVLDLALPGINGLELIAILHRRWPSTRILAYTAHTEEHKVICTLNTGASGYVLKSSSQQVLIAALQTLATHKSYIDPALNRKAILFSLENAESNHRLLTLRESQVLKLIADGNSNRIIGEQLYISVKTVETHRLNIMRKLNVHKVTELLNCSRRLGLID